MACWRGRLCGEAFHRVGQTVGPTAYQKPKPLVVREAEEAALDVSLRLAEQVELDIVSEYLNAVRGQKITYGDVHTQLEFEMREIRAVCGWR